MRCRSSKIVRIGAFKSGYLGLFLRISSYFIVVLIAENKNISMIKPFYCPTTELPPICLSFKSSDNFTDFLLFNFMYVLVLYTFDHRS